jgi:hypothetical protein
MTWIKSSSLYSSSINPNTYIFQSFTGKLKRIGVFVYVNHDLFASNSFIRHIGKFTITGQIQTFLGSYGDIDNNYVNFPLLLNSIPFKIEFEFYDASSYTMVAGHTSGYSVMLISEKFDIDIKNQQIAIVIYAIPEIISLQDAYIEIEGE